MFLTFGLSAASTAAAGWVLYRTRGPGLINVLTMAILVFWLVYAIIPMALLFSHECQPLCRGWSLTSAAAVVVGWIALLAGIFLGRTDQEPDAIRHQASEPSIILLLAPLAVASVSLVVLIHALGGPAQAFSSAAVMRIWGTVNFEVGPGAIATYFVPLAYVSLAAGINYSFSSRLKRLSVTIALAAAGVLVAHFLVTGSRGTLMNGALLCSVVLLANQKAKISPKLIPPMVALGAFGLALVAYGKAALLTMSRLAGGEPLSATLASFSALPPSAILQRLVLEFSFPSRSIEAAVSADVTPNFGMYFWTAPIHLLPKKLLGIENADPVRIFEVNNVLLGGNGLPPGIVASLYHAGHLVGIVIGLAIFGYVLAGISRRAGSLRGTLGIVWLYVGYHCVWFITNGDPSVLLKDSAHLGVLAVICAAAKGLRR